MTRHHTIRIDDLAIQIQSGVELTCVGQAFRKRFRGEDPRFPSWHVDGELVKIDILAFGAE